MRNDGPLRISLKGRIKRSASYKVARHAFSRAAMLTKSTQDVTRAWSFVKKHVTASRHHIIGFWGKGRIDLDKRGNTDLRPDMRKVLSRNTATAHTKN